MGNLQTLDRGLRVLELISISPDGVSINVIAEHLGVHRTIAHRIVATLQEHHLVARSHTGIWRLGAFAATLSRRFAPQLLRIGRPVLRELVSVTGLTSFLSVGENEECVVVLTEECHPGKHGLRVSYQEGTRHSLHLGASGVAILATRPATPDDPSEVRKAREAGYSITRGELQRGAVGVSVGIVRSETMRQLEIEASVGVVGFGDLDIGLAASAAQEAAQRLADLLDT